MAQSQFHPIKGPLARTLGRLATKGQLAALAPVVSESLGPAFKDRVRPVALENGVLSLEADAESLEILLTMRGLLIARLRELMGAGAPTEVRLVPLRGRLPSA